jgi:hypothetical protein
LQPLVDFAQVELPQGGAEVLVVEDLLEDLLVGVDTSDDGLKELLVEDKAEVIQAVILRMVGQFSIGDPALLELIEEQLVDLALNGS